MAAVARKPKFGVTREWRKLFKLLPGYDPCATAGPGDRFDEEAAGRAIGFIQDCCRHIEGSTAGEPFLLEDWQRAVVGCLFGWLRRDGYRRYRKLFLYVPRGSGKTPMVAAMALYLLYCDGEAGAQIYLIASTAEQAALAYRHARGMVERNPDLEAAAQIFKGQGHRSITLRADPAAFIRVVPCDAAGLHGYMPHAVIADELHAWDGREAVDAIKTAFAKKSRRQPLEIYATTADFDRPSACNDEYDYAVMVRDNGGDPSKPGYDRETLPVIFEAQVTDDWTDEKVWEKANPNIDVTVSRESLRESCRRAKDQPALQAEFKRLHLNIRSSSRTVFIPLERWDRLARSRDAYAALRAARRICLAGLDLSSKIDLTAFAVAWPPTTPDGLFLVDVHCWLPEQNILERERRDKVPYRLWAEQGWLTLTPGDLIDLEAVERHILEVHRRTQLEQVGFDTWNASGIDVRLRNSGVNMLAIPQQLTSLTPGTKAMIELAAGDGKLAHDGNPVLRWAISNAETKADLNENIRPVKPEYAKTGKRIDPVMAAVMALGLARSRVANTPQIISLAKR